ncbi:hypothetical protein D3C73_1047550 [compost metagenome]
MRADIAADNRLNRCDNMRRRHNRIKTGIGNGSMRAFALHLDLEAVRRRHKRSTCNADRADRQIRLVMQAQHRADSFKCAALNDLTGADPLLLRRLKQQPNSALQLVLALLQQVGGAENCGGVKVMAACMHFSRNGRSERQMRLLLYGKSVDIRPQCNGRSAKLAPNLRNDSRSQRE